MSWLVCSLVTPLFHGNPCVPKLELETQTETENGTFFRCSLCSELGRAAVAPPREGAQGSHRSGASRRSLFLLWPSLVCTSGCGSLSDGATGAAVTSTKYVNIVYYRCCSSYHDIMFVLSFLFPTCGVGFIFSRWIGILRFLFPSLVCPLEMCDFPDLPELRLPAGISGKPPLNRRIAHTKQRGRFYCCSSALFFSSLCPLVAQQGGGGYAWFCGCCFAGSERSLKLPDHNSSLVSWCPVSFSFFRVGILLAGDGCGVQ